MFFHFQLQTSTSHHSQHSHHQCVDHSTQHPPLFLPENCRNLLCASTFPSFLISNSSSLAEQYFQSTSLYLFSLQQAPKSIHLQLHHPKFLVKKRKTISSFSNLAYPPRFHTISVSHAHRLEHTQ